MKAQRLHSSTHMLPCMPSARGAWWAACRRGRTCTVRGVCGGAAGEDEEDEEDEDEAPKTEKVKETVWDWELLNENKALWLRTPGEVDEEDYANFYQALAKVRTSPSRPCTAPSHSQLLSWPRHSAQGPISCATHVITVCCLHARLDVGEVTNTHAHSVFPAPQPGCPAVMLGFCAVAC